MYLINRTLITQGFNIFQRNHISFSTAVSQSSTSTGAKFPDFSLLFHPEKFTHRRPQTESLLQLEQECNELIPSWKSALPLPDIPSFTINQSRSTALPPCTTQLVPSEPVTTKLQPRAESSQVLGLFNDIIPSLSAERAQSVAESRALWEEAGPAPEGLDENFLSDPQYSAVQKQRWSEEQSLFIAVSKYRDLKKSVEQLGRAANLRPAERLVLRWLDQLAEAIQGQFIDKFFSLTGDSLQNLYGPFMTKVSPEQIAVLVLHEVISSTLKSARKGLKFTTLCLQIADAVQSQLDYERIRGGASKHQFRTYLANPTIQKVEHASRALELERPDTAARVKLGAWLLRLLLEVAHLPRTALQPLAPDDEALQAPPLTSTEGLDLADPDMALFKEAFVEARPADSCVEPAFEYFLASAKAQRPGKGHQVGKIRCTLALLRAVEEDHASIESLGARFQPMVIPPLRWVGTDNGSYLITTVYQDRIQMMRSKGAIQRSPLRDGQHDLSLLCHALDVLGRTPWVINRFVYETQKEAWEAGGGVAEVPSKGDIPFPPPLSAAEQQDPARRRQHRRETQKVQQLNYDAHGLRCCFRYQHKVAKDYLALDAVYFPHNVDFRGRAYPLPPHLNHMGADVCRGLLTFAESQPLGKEGLYWLKVHLCNLFGNNKMSFDDRVRFTEQHIDDIRDSAYKPLAGARWWATAEEPWQALAACRDLATALDTCKNPEDYVSSLPVHADGSCNGLQHYAALGGDIHGARAVNLHPDLKPNDVYSGVAERVARSVAEDALNPDSPNHATALLLNGKIVRKTIKQTVMTKVYGVTRPGARLQIENALKDLGTIPSTLPDVDKVYWRASNYLAGLTFDALRDMFSAATIIMEWLQDCAGLISAKDHPVSWVSPIGLPIIQHYRRPSLKRVQTIVQQVSLEDSNQPISLARQKSAFPPNFVHSLDSSHMFFTSLRMHQEGLTFASVHDSYWTHARNLPRMGRLLREEFVRLHSQPLLFDLYDHFRAVHPNINFPPVPARGQFDLKNVLDSPYFFH